MKIKNTVQSTQEQAVASWINYLNQVRLDRLLSDLAREQQNVDSAFKTINDALFTISDKIVENGLGRGGAKGMHGFIAEIAECGIRNAREIIEGKAPIYEWIDDNGPSDLRRGVEFIQQKFVNSGGHLSLEAVFAHSKKYPDFVKNGGIYQIPSDHFERIKWLLSIPEREANRMSSSDGSFSLKQWKEVHDFFSRGEIPLEKIEPSALDYESVQRDKYVRTMTYEMKNLGERHQERVKEAYLRSKPSFTEGAKITAASAAIEGSMSFCLGIIEKRKSGKKLKDFDRDDWSEIAGKTGIGTAKGGIRAASIYLLTNHTATPASVASTIVTASFGVAEQAHKFRNGELDETAFIENSEMLCLDASVSALSSFAGQVLIPVPVIGAVIGNAVGTMLYKIAKDSLSEKEQEILEQHLQSIRTLESEVQKQYQDFILGLAENMILFMNLLERAFAPDIRIAFEGSVELALEMGVPTEEILDSREKVFSYFLD